ncbi:uncharacterized protein METZ01_LOCUS498436, partial [marine metagenome]
VNESVDAVGEAHVATHALVASLWASSLHQPVTQSTSASAANRRNTLRP